MRERVKKIFRNLEEDVDVIVIAMGTETKDNTFFYVTGFEEGLFENSMAIIYPTGEHEIICPQVEEGIAGSRALIFRTVDERNRFLKDIISGENIGINGEGLSYKGYKTLKKLFPRAKFFDAWNAIAKARLTKDEAEIQCLRKACRISAAIATQLPHLFEDEVRECDLKAEIDYIMGKQDASPAFATIVAFGKNSARPHHRGGTKKFTMPALCDFGARYKGYCSDMTRTYVSANKQEKIYEIVEEGQNLAFDMMTAGVKGGDIAKCVNAFFIKKGCKKMIHSLGHSIGLSPHDGFSINEKNNEVLRERMVVAVEPALYFRNEWGVRIEDDVLVKKNRSEVLTK